MDSSVSRTSCARRETKPTSAREKDSNPGKARLTSVGLRNSVPVRDSSRQGAQAVKKALEKASWEVSGMSLSGLG